VKDRSHLLGNCPLSLSSPYVEWNRAGARHSNVELSVYPLSLRYGASPFKKVVRDPRRQPCGQTQRPAIGRNPLVHVAYRPMPSARAASAMASWAGSQLGCVVSEPVPHRAQGVITATDIGSSSLALGSRQLQLAIMDAPIGKRWNCQSRNSMIQCRGRYDALRAMDTGSLTTQSQLRSGHDGHRGRRSRARHRSISDMN